jgi:catechol 2,3-dioxygenase-like lactoylglutathione lyase family enzyme
MQMRLELFVADLEKSRDFYVRILGFEVESADPRGYTRLRRGDAAIALNPVERIPSSHPSRQAPGAAVGLGHEISLVVEEIERYYKAVTDHGGEIAEPLKERPWGSRDFCLHDPDGNYIRITS